MWLTLLTLALSTVLNALYYIPAVTVLWSKPQPEEKGETLPVDKTFTVSTVCFIAAVLVLGIFFDPIMTVIETGVALL